MRRALAYRVVAVLVIVSVGTLAYVAAKHSHHIANANDSAHCRICLAAHSGMHGVTPSTAFLEFVPLVTGSVTSITPVTFVSMESHPEQGRAPPNS